MEAAKPVCDRWTSYGFAADGGTWVAFLVEHPDFRLPPPEPARVIRVLTEGISGASGHWRAIRSYAARRPLGVRASDDRSQIALSAPAVDLTIDFDPLGRVAEIHGQLGGQMRG